MKLRICQIPKQNGVIEQYLIVFLLAFKKCENTITRLKQQMFLHGTARFTRLNVTDEVIRYSFNE